MTLKMCRGADDISSVASGSRNPDEIRTGSTKQAFQTLVVLVRSGACTCESQRQGSGKPCRSKDASSSRHQKRKRRSSRHFYIPQIARSSFSHVEINPEPRSCSRPWLCWRFQSQPRLHKLRSGQPTRHCCSIRSKRCCSGRLWWCLWQKRPEPATHQPAKDQPA